jgi:predicted nucleotidyltransferase
MLQSEETRFDETLKLLTRHEVEFIVVGGVAAVLEGSPVLTFDLDIVYNTSESNSDRLAAALVEINARYKDPAGRHIVPDVPRLLTMRLHLLETDLGPLDVLRAVGDGLGYEELLARSVVHDLDDFSIRAIDLETLIEAKEYANRPKDHHHLLFLRQLLDLKQAG